jgi:hypothetical protein
VSMNRNPKRFANNLPSVVFPEAIGPTKKILACWCSSIECKQAIERGRQIHE